MLSENLAALVRRVLAPIDFPLLAILGLLMAYALVVQLSASSDAPARINAHLLNVAVALAVMWILASVPLARLMNLAVPLYVCLLYTSPSPRDGLLSRMPSSA